jgi:hypothetical protein
VVVLAGLVLPVVLISGAARAGGRYFYCEAMGMLQWDPCAERSGSRPADDPVDTVAPHHMDCCQVGMLPSLPEGSTVATPSVPPPPLTAVVPVRELRMAHSARLAGPSAVAALERSRPPPHSAAERRTALMVFLT